MRTLTQSQAAALNKSGKALGVPPEWIANVIAAETGGSFSPSAKNVQGGRILAVGLIQFTATTAAELGTTFEALLNMTFSEQMEFVTKYLARKIKRHGNPRNWLELYELVFYPTWFGKPQTVQLPDSAYKANRGIDTNKDGRITKADFYKWALKKVPSSQPLPSVVPMGLILAAVGIFLIFNNK